MKLVKTMVVFLSILSVVCQARTIEDCNEELNALNAERVELQKEPLVRYRKRDSQSSNFEKRLKVVEINHEFKRMSHRGLNDYGEWLRYCGMIKDSEKRQKRIEEINARIKAINAEKSDILKMRKKQAKK